MILRFSYRNFVVNTDLTTGGIEIPRSESTFENVLDNELQLIFPRLKPPITHVQQEYRAASFSVRIGAEQVAAYFEDRALGGA